MTSEDLEATQWLSGPSGVRNNWNKHIASHSSFPIVPSLNLHFSSSHSPFSSFHAALTCLSRSALLSGELIVGGAYSWSSTTPTNRARGEHPCYTTGTQIFEHCSSLLVSRVREQKYTWKLCKFKLAKFLMEIAVTPEWSCLGLKHCCNQYRPSRGWRPRTFCSPVCRNNGGDHLLFFPDSRQTSRYGSGYCRLWHWLRETNTKRSVLSRSKQQSSVWSGRELTGHRGAEAALDQLILKQAFGCFVFTHTGDAEPQTHLLVSICA